MRRNGFTLIEFIMASAIGIFVFGAIASLLMGGVAGVKSVGEFHQVYYESRRAIQWVNRDVKESYSILNTATIGGTPYTTDKDTLILQRSSGTDGNYDYVVYDLVGDGTDALGNNIYRLDRKFFDNYTVLGTTQTGSSNSTKIVAKDVVAPTGSQYIFNAAGTKVSVDLTISRQRHRTREQLVLLDGGSIGTPGSGNQTATSSLRLVSEIKMRN
ncbi:MAG: prepilin-type N-terminal cleavage/methylation domain-containing protein [Candidatus Omnitrophica bacterium]|nr:prepilin-type N-terminal cleavage/methylation domain-containing protein [Candidatus Omnitrophota bacterium]